MFDAQCGLKDGWYLNGVRLGPNRGLTQEWIGRLRFACKVNGVMCYEDPTVPNSDGPARGGALSEL
jgi:hypothetical protein